MDWSGGYTSRIEAKKTVDVGAEALSKFARIFGVSIDWLVDGKGETPSADSIRSAVAKAKRRKAA